MSWYFTPLLLYLPVFKSEKGLGDAIRTFSECSRDDIEANMRRRIHKGCVTDGTTSLGDLAGVFV